MQKFQIITEVPIDFEGQCFIVDYECVCWFIKGKKYHRKDGPALIFDDGIKIWYENDKRHRLNGPAVINQNGWQEEEFWIDDTEYEEEDYWQHPLVVKNKLSSILNIDNLT